jgi:hypothetical protein
VSLASSGRIELAQSPLTSQAGRPQLGHRRALSITAPLDISKVCLEIDALLAQAAPPAPLEPNPPWWKWRSNLRRTAPTGTSLRSVDVDSIEEAVEDVPEEDGEERFIGFDEM